MYWGSLAVVACCIMEGSKCKVILSWWRSNLERSKLILCINRLLRHDIQLGINLSRYILAGVTYWGWPSFCKSEDWIIFQENGRFSEKPTGSLNYHRAWLQMSKNKWVWSLLGDDLAFRDFCSRNFPSFSVRRIT